MALKWNCIIFWRCKQVLSQPGHGYSKIFEALSPYTIYTLGGGGGTKNAKTGRQSIFDQILIYCGNIQEWLLALSQNIIAIRLSIYNPLFGECNDQIGEVKC